jgi:hypothetical protein
MSVARQQAHNIDRSRSHPPPYLPENGLKNAPWSLASQATRLLARFPKIPLRFQQNTAALLSPGSSENSLFPPRCGHALRAHSAFPGLANAENYQ